MMFACLSPHCFMVTIKRTQRIQVAWGSIKSLENHYGQTHIEIMNKKRKIIIERRLLILKSSQVIRGYHQSWWFRKRRSPELWIFSIALTWLTCAYICYESFKIKQRLLFQCMWTSVLTALQFSSALELIQQYLPTASGTLNSPK
jgi:hypothetical protein